MKTSTILAAAALALALVMAGGCTRTETVKHETSYSSSPPITKGDYKPKRTTSYQMAPPRFNP